MMVWIREHPYMTGGLVLLLIVVIVVFKRRSSSSAVVVAGGPSDATVAASVNAYASLMKLNAETVLGESQLNAAVAGKKIDAATTLALAGASKDVSLATIYADQQVKNRAADVALQSTQYQTDAILNGQRLAADVANTQTAAGVKVAGIQADVTNEKTQAALAAQGIISQASVDMANINAESDKARTDAALALGINTNDANVTLGLDANKTQLGIATTSSDTAKTIATLQAQSQDLITKTSGNVYTDMIDSQSKNIDNYINTQGAIKQNQNNIVYGLISSGQINKGGEGGQFQAGVLNTLLTGSPTPGVAAAQSASAQGQAGANMLTNIGSFITKGFLSLFG